MLNFNLKAKSKAHDHYSKTKGNLLIAHAQKKCFSFDKKAGLFKKNKMFENENIVLCITFWQIFDANITRFMCNFSLFCRLQNFTETDVFSITYLSSGMDFALKKVTLINLLITIFFYR